jgi:hypothetical protein
MNSDNMITFRANDAENAFLEERYHARNRSTSDLMHNVLADLMRRTWEDGDGGNDKHGYRKVVQTQDLRLDTYEAAEITVKNKQDYASGLSAQELARIAGRAMQVMEDQRQYIKQLEAKLMWYMANGGSCFTQGYIRTDPLALMRDIVLGKGR